jgi:hypothetical protein
MATNIQVIATKCYDFSDEKLAPKLEKAFGSSYKLKKDGKYKRNVYMNGQYVGCAKIDYGHQVFLYII